MNKEVYKGNCLDYMRGLPDNHFDLLLTDPPYMIGISNNPIRQKHAKKNWDSEKVDEDIISEMFRVSKNQIIWGGNYFELPSSKGFLIWDKKQPYDFSLAMCEYAYSSFNRPAKMFRYSNRGDEDKVHPTQKPLELMKWCIKYASESDKTIKTIFDPFLGSGTTMVASMLMGYDCYGCELDQDYQNVIDDRLNETEKMINNKDSVNAWF